jgi:hypothetical protein
MLCEGVHERESYALIRIIKRREYSWHGALRCLPLMQQRVDHPLPNTPVGIAQGSKKVRQGNVNLISHIATGRKRFGSSKSR